MLSNLYPYTIGFEEKNSWEMLLLLRSGMFEKIPSKGILKLRRITGTSAIKYRGFQTKIQS
jgi:hypothetical protein